MRQFYCRVQRWSEPSGETAGTVGGERGWWRWSWALMRLQRSSRECLGWTWEEYTRGRGQTGGAAMEDEKQSDVKTRLKRERREGRRASGLELTQLPKKMKWGEGKWKEEDTCEGARRGRRERDHKSSRLPHHILYPPLVSHPPRLPTTPPRQPPHPRSLAPSASPWQPDRVPNTWT